MCQNNVDNIIKPIKYSVFILKFVLLSLAVQSYGAEAASNPQSNHNVLVVHSSYQDYPWTASMHRGVHEGFSDIPESIEFWTEYIDTKRNLDPVYFQKLHELFNAKYQERELDLIIAIDNEAYDFIMEDRDTLFAGIPIVFAGYIGYEPGLLDDHPLITGVIQENSFEETIDVALRLHPETQKVVFVLPDAWPVRMAWVEHFPELYAGRVEFARITANTLESIDSELAKLGQNIIVIPLNSFLLDSGEYLSFEDLVFHLSLKGAYPVYGLWDIALNHGIVGGKLVSGKSQGREASRLALQILRGDAVSEVPVVDNSPNSYMFDWIQMQRFNINVDDLPVGTVVINRPESFYEKNKLLTWAVLSALLFLMALVVSLSLNIRRRKRVEHKLTYQASHDALTGLVNRREFENRAERLLSTKGQKKGEHALCYMDLDQFKVINDNYGHNAGDELLRQLGAELQKVVRKSDTLARLGGDEFGVLMERCSLDDAYRVADSLLKVIQEHLFLWEEHSLRIGASIGLVSIPQTAADLTQLLQNADAACYRAKDTGRNRIHIFNDDDTEIAQRLGEMKWVERIHHALESNLFCLYAQAIVPLSSSSDKHYEILIRMQGEDGRIIPPGAFLPAAEQFNLIAKIDQWVIRKSFQFLSANPVFLKQVSFCSINLSGQSLSSSDILDFIIDQLEQSGVDGSKLCFEITETAAISNLKIATKFISILKGLGCQFALDDFGSGLSSFAYLKNLSVDYLKIDGMFVKDIVDDPIDHAMVKSINEIGQVMGMKTIAEFVENDEIKHMLCEIGVNYAQGYGIEEPLPLDTILLSFSGNNKK